MQRPTLIDVGTTTGRSQLLLHQFFGIVFEPLLGGEIGLNRGHHAFFNARLRLLKRYTVCIGERLGNRPSQTFNMLPPQIHSARAYLYPSGLTTQLCPRNHPSVGNDSYPLASRTAQARPTCVSIGDGRVRVGNGHYLLVAGPCAVESEEQLLTTAKAVAAAGAKALRGGVFKPRTSPYDFQGLGEPGLKLLAKAREVTGLPVITEVLDPRHVALTAEYADVIQIGSRNTQNYPLLKEVGRIRRPVLLKRGMSMTIREWLLSAEYILSEGNPNIILCERGIRTFETATRHTLDLNAIPVLKELTHLPVIVDPSHGTGNAAYVPAMARAAMAAGADGLMIEVHPDPTHAASDGKQALDLPTFAALAASLL